MATPILKGQGHSALVYMELRLNGNVFPIAQMAPGFLVLHKPVDHPPADGEVFLRIDDSESSWRVHLVEGISPQRRKTKVSPLPPLADRPSKVPAGTTAEIKPQLAD